MFEGVINRHLLERAARRSGYSVGAAALETLVIVGLVMVTARLAARRAEPPLVEVQFIRSVPRPPPPAAAPPSRHAARARDAPRAAAASAVSARLRAPTALIQPRDVAEEMKPPDPREPLEEYDDAVGVAGGVIGGIPGYVPEAAGASEVVNAAFTRGEQTIEEAPQYATRGFRPPAEAQPGCVRSMVRVPAALAGYVSAPVVVKFAVGRTGTLGDIQFMTPLADPRIADVIRNALRACRWVPGSDAQGRPTPLWVVMPFRFEAG